MSHSLRIHTLLFTVLFSSQLLAESAAELGLSLTPLGAERAANAAGTIPEWTGGITQAPSSYQAGKHYADPFASDGIQFTINAGNVSQHADKLTAGHQALIKAYPDSYEMNVYPTRRSASAPDWVYEATKMNATRAKLSADGNGVEGAANGIPFPVPSKAEEVIWNHVLRYRGENVERTVGQAAPTRGGDYTLVKLQEQAAFHYSQRSTTIESVDNLIAYFKQEVRAPARLAGGFLLVHETMNQNEENRKAWVYNPGQRRVRRAPNVAFDNPGTASDGLRTNDQLDLFNGSLERYDWKLLGKKEIYVPYNNYKLHGPNLSYKDILTKNHINPAYPRYELHRVWVVDATLKSGSRHLYKRRTFYIDEDSWQILAVDIYDNRDQLWRVSEGFAINYYDLPATWYTLEVHTDLQAGRYLAFGLHNEYGPYDFRVDFSASNFTPAALRREGTR